MVIVIDQVLKPPSMRRGHRFALVPRTNMDLWLQQSPRRAGLYARRLSVSLTRRESGVPRIREDHLGSDSVSHSGRGAIYSMQSMGPRPWSCSHSITSLGRPYLPQRSFDSRTSIAILPTSR